MVCRFLEDPIEEEAVSLCGEFLICWEIILRPLLDALSLVFLCGFLHICIIFSVCLSCPSWMCSYIWAESLCNSAFFWFLLFCFAFKWKGFFSEIIFIRSSVCTSVLYIVINTVHLCFRSLISSFALLLWYSKYSTSLSWFCCCYCCFLLLFVCFNNLGESQLRVEG